MINNYFINFKTFAKVRDTLQMHKKRQHGEDPLKNIDARDLSMRFKSKKDIYQYLSEQCKFTLFLQIAVVGQYYMPPRSYVNKDFLKEVFAGKKDLIPRD